MLSDTTPQNETVIACDPSGITPEEMERWIGVIVPQVYKAVQEIQELPDGWAWRLPSEPEILMLVAEDLNMERRCCPFVNYTLEITPNKGPFWLRMTGGEGVKAFLRMSFESANYLDQEVMKAAGWDTSAAQDLDSVDAVLAAVDTLNDSFAKSKS
jgi:hypothetical protein